MRGSLFFIGKKLISNQELALLEVAPPGMEGVVESLKRKGTVGNPFAVAWSMHGRSLKRQKSKTESMSAGAAGPVLRGKKRRKAKAKGGPGSDMKMSKRESFCESASVLETGPKEGAVVKVVLISEGLGNLRDKNYYGPEAIQSAPTAFEGAVCMIDHPSYSEEQDIPEGRVNRTVGYYKNVHVESVNGKLACVGELHFDRSEEGMNAFQKARSAVHYSEEFPTRDKEYIGLSVNATGESEPRTMTVEGQDMDVNYVVRFVEARSCDLVTIPARGGKIVALVESVAGARMKTKEVRMKTVKSLEAASAALKEARKEKDPDLRDKKISEAQKQVDSLLKDIMEATARKKSTEAEMEDESESESETESENEAETESETENDPSLRVAARGKQKDESEGYEDDGDGDTDDDSDSGDSHTVVSKKIVHRTGKAALQAESDREARRDAVSALIAKLNIKECFTKEDVDDLSRKPYREAKKEIERIRRMSEANVAKVLKAIGSDVSAVNRHRESGSSNSGEIDAVNNAEFADVSL